MANIFTATPIEAGGGSTDMWTSLPGSSTRETVTSDVATDPRGTSLADRFEENYATFNSSFRSTLRSLLSVSTTYFNSVFLKADEITWVVIYNGASTVSEGQYFDIANGVVGGTYNNATTNAGIVPYGNGWYRCWIETSSNASGQCGFSLYTASSDGGIIHTGTIGDGFHAWGIWMDEVNYTDWNPINESPIRFGMDSSVGGNDVVVGSADGWTSAVSSGDPIFCFVSFRHSTSGPIGTITPPTGFSLIDSFTTESGTTTVPGCAIYYKISDGTETSFTVQTSGATLNTGVFIAAWDQTGLYTESNSFVTDLDSSLWLTTGTDITCGSATNTTADAVAIAVVFAETTSTEWASGTWSNSFNEYQEDDWANAGLVMATKRLTSIASQSTLQEGTGTGTQLLSALIIMNALSDPYVSLNSSQRRRADPRIKM